jgi:hypothetical protein
MAAAAKCAPEVDLNGAVRYRELRGGLKFTSGIVQVQRWH